MARLDALAERERLPSATKPWLGSGAGVFEMVREFDTDAYRAVYLVRFAQAIYVLHAFQKKSPKGRRTDARDIAAVDTALRSAAEHHKTVYERRTPA